MVRYSRLVYCALPVLATQAMSQTTLREAAEAVGLNIGIATNSFHLNTAAYTNIAKTQFNIVVCENETKFESVERSENSFNYANPDKVYDFAKSNDMKMRGHTYVWHSQSGWASNVNGSRQRMLDIMKNHISNVGGHFAGKILEWDVLNEITDDGNGNALRNSFWKRTIGEDYVDSAFVWAHKADPSSYSYYNDYGADGVNGKSTSMFNLVKKLQSAKIPIHGIGLQSHLGARLNNKSISDNVKRFGELGVRISMTEIDIPGSTTTDWVNLMNACLENFNCVSFVAWGLADGNSWIRNCNGCLLYGGNANNPTAKPELINALIDAMKKADPAVVAKRKAFAARLPGPNGLIDPVSVQMARKELKRQNLLGSFNSQLGATPVFSIDARTHTNVLGRQTLQVQYQGSHPISIQAK